jgi:tetratricopeptide (TPR) repeat protein
MKWIKHISWITLMVLPFMLAAQSDEMTKKAAQLCNSGDLIGAERTINEALKGDEARTAYAWFVKGFIHKEIYKQIEKQSPVSTNRETAVDAIYRCLELDVKGTYYDDNLKALRFLAVTYYNDAVDLINSLSPESTTQPESYFAQFKAIMKVADPFYDFRDNDIDFYKAMAQGYETLHKSYPGNQDYINSSIRYYKLALAINPEDYESNYNTAINYYNRGVQRIGQIDHNTEIFELLLIQEECIKLFKQSLPFMLKAHKKDPKRKETLKGLMAIYRALNEYEKSDHYKQTLQDLISQGVIRDDSKSGK